MENALEDLEQHSDTPPFSIYVWPQGCAVHHLVSTVQPSGCTGMEQVFSFAHGISCKPECYTGNMAKGHKELEIYTTNFRSTFTRTVGWESATVK